MSINLDYVLKVLSIPSAALAIVAAWKALPLETELKSLQGRAQTLDLELRAADGRLREAEARLKEAESGRKLTFDLYQEVRKILEKKDRTPRDEEALRVLIESLAEDPFRYRLLSVLAVSASSPQTQQAARESASFFRDESSILESPAPSVPQAREGIAAAALGGMNVDVFYCASKQTTSEPIAERIVALKEPGESGRWRLRLLPESINKQPGYGITANEIRYNVPDETEAARVLAERIRRAGHQISLRESQQLTKWYISVFVCE